MSQATAVAGAAAVLGRTALAAFDGAADAPPAPNFSLADATHATFARHIGSAFELETSDGNVFIVVLTEVTPLPRHRRGDALRDPFSLCFTAQHGAAVVGELVTVGHADLGRFDLFVHSAGPRDRCRYEAVFG